MCATFVRESTSVDDDARRRCGHPIHRPCAFGVLVGAAHPHKVDSRRLLERLVTEGRRLVTDVEVLQEILHRFVAVNRRDAIQPCFDVLLEIVDEVLEIDHPHFTGRVRPFSASSSSQPGLRSTLP